MLGETLFESSPFGEKQTRWPIASGFLLQITLAFILVSLSWVPARIGPGSMRVPLLTAPIFKRVDARRQPISGSSQVGRSAPGTVVSLSRTPSHIAPGRTHVATGEPNPPTDLSFDFAQAAQTWFPLTPTAPVSPKGPLGRQIISHSAEAQLVEKVAPEYPVPALRAGIEGDVKLQAVVSREGTIEDLVLISGHPLLAPAAMAAVKQWRYRPFFLNGQPVEGETLITIRFRRNGGDH